MKSTIMQKLHNTKILAIIGSVCLLLSVVLPYITISFFGISESIFLWKYWQGIVLIIIAILNILFIFKEAILKHVPSLANNQTINKILAINNPKASLVLTIIMVIFVICLTAITGFAFRFYNIGFYTLWLGVICLVLYPFLYKKEESFINADASTKDYSRKESQDEKDN